MTTQTPRPDDAYEDVAGQSIVSEVATGVLLGLWGFTISLVAVLMLIFQLIGHSIDW
jgi:hypothetical protein